MQAEGWDTPLPEDPDQRSEEELAAARHRKQHNAQVRDLEHRLAAYRRTLAMELAGKTRPDAEAEYRGKIGALEEQLDALLDEEAD
jgi:hypothetical protein